MKQDLFRKKTIDQLSSPDQLSDYIRVSSPAMWMVLGGIVFLLLGVCVWGVFGRLDTTLQTAAVSRGGRLVLLTKEADAEKLRPGMTVTVNKNTHAIVQVSDQLVQPETDSLVSHYGGFEDGEWVCLAELDGAEPEGVYSASVLIESIAPMKFALN